MTVNKKERIAIIGAGISGIFTAIELKKLGYENITLYEKGDRITTTTTTLNHKDYKFDIATKLIPAIHITHDGIYPPLKELLDKTGLELEIFPNPYFYDFDTKKLMPLPLVLQQFNKIKMVRDFAKGYELLVEINKINFLEDVFKTDLIKADESLYEWSKRHDVEAFGVAMAYLLDQFNMGPSHDIPAGVFLLSRIHAMAPLLHSVLSKNGVKHFFKLFGKGSLEFKKFINYKPKAGSFFFVKEGYEEVFRRLVAEFQLDIKLDCAVSNLNKDDDGLKFTVNNAEQVQCDKVIFCCPPVAIANISYHPDAKQLLEGVKPNRTIRSWVFEASNWNEKTFGKTGHVIDGTDRLALTTRQMQVNGELMYVFKEFPDSDLIVSLVYYDKMSEAELEKALRLSLERFNLKLEKIISYKDFVWPLHPTVEQNKAGWVTSMEELQGIDNIYYNGEAFCGIGVPPVLENTMRFTKKHFN